MKWLPEFSEDQPEILFDFVPAPPHIMVCINGVCSRRYLTTKDRDKIADFIAKATKWVISPIDDKVQS